MKHILLFIFCITVLSFGWVADDGHSIPNGCADRPNCVNIFQNKFLFFRNISGNIDSCEVDSHTVLVFLKEPSCTGCKDQLAEYLFMQKSDYKVVLVLPFTGSGFFRKMEIAQVQSVFSKSNSVVFSLTSGDTLEVHIDTNIQKIAGGGFPKMVTVSNIESKIYVTKVDYPSLFQDTRLNYILLDSLLNRACP